MDNDLIVHSLVPLAILLKELLKSDKRFISKRLTFITVFMLFSTWVIWPRGEINYTFVFYFYFFVLCLMSV